MCASTDIVQTALGNILLIKAYKNGGQENAHQVTGTTISMCGSQRDELTANFQSASSSSHVLRIATLGERQKTRGESLLVTAGNWRVTTMRASRRADSKFQGNRS
jgi:hypothetical protein